MVFEDPEVDPEQANGRTAHEVVEEYRRLQSAYRGSFHSEKDFYKEKNSIETGPALEDVDLDTSIKPTRSREPSSTSSASVLRWILSPWKENEKDENKNKTKRKSKTKRKRKEKNLETTNANADLLYTERAKEWMAETFKKTELNMPKVAIEKSKKKSISISEELLASPMETKNSEKGYGSEKGRNKLGKDNFEADTQWLLQPYRVEASVEENKGMETLPREDSFTLFMQEISDLHKTS